MNRFFAPSLVSAHVPGDESAIIGNYRRTNVREIHLHTVHDAPQTASALLRWDLFHLDGRRLITGKKAIILRPGENRAWKTLDLEKPMKIHGRDHLHLWIALEKNGKVVSEDTVFLTPPRFMLLQKARTRFQLRKSGPEEIHLGVTSDVFQHRFHFEFPGVPVMATDNFFDLYPNETKHVLLTIPRGVSMAALRQALTFGSLVDTYR